jgi:carbamoyltransferase
MAELCLGIARARLGPSAAILDSDRGIAACEENRLTRARQAPTAGPPSHAIAELLAYLGRAEPDLATVAVVRDENSPQWFLGDAVAIEPHHAHAEYAYRASGFDDALVVVCDASLSSGWTAWRYRGHGTSSALPTDFDVGSFPVAQIYGELTSAFGLQAARDEHVVEAIGRASDVEDRAVADDVALTDHGIQLSDRFRDMLAVAGQQDEKRRRQIAAGVQRRLGECLAELLSRLARASGARKVCLSGGLFFNTQFTTLAAHCGAFEQTFIPSHPGRSGSALGAALLVAQKRPAAGVVSDPYLGPGYTDADIKAAIESCKLSFDLQREEQVIDTVLGELSRGRLVGWFHGRMEWGPRALGHRTVLADPFSPHVLDNLNGYLKKRPPYRTYGVSVPAAHLSDLFEVPAGLKPRHYTPAASPYMQYEYAPRDPEKFRALLPEGVRTLRVHTVDQSEPRYLRLLERWGEMSGTPALVNTSFNGFHEPLVCSPRDAIRVFYGTGLDLLALEDFVMRK